MTAFRAHLQNFALLYAAIVVSYFPAHSLAQPPLIEAEEQAFQSAVAFVADSVVQIELFGGADVVGEELAGIGPVTGTIVGAEGWIITSNYILKQNPASILVVLPDGKRKAAKLISEDKHRELALIKIDVDQPLVPVTVAPLDELELGYWAIAVGKTFDPAIASQSVGILSAKQRVWGRAVQTDAKVSPHNYGGPLIDIKGRAIGILAPLSDEDGTDGMEWYDSGIGFAVPMQQIMDRLQTMESGTSILPGRIGIATTARDTYSGPLKVALAAANSPAAKAGIKRGDILVELDGQKLSMLRDLKMALGPKDAGQMVDVKVDRGGKVLEFECELAAVIPPYDPPYLGIIPGRSDLPGVLVAGVLPGTPAAEAGLKAGDKIASVAEQKTLNVQTLREALSVVAPKTPLEISVIRKSTDEAAEGKAEEASLTVTLIRWPGEIPTDLPEIQLAAEAANESPDRRAEGATEEKSEDIEAKEDQKPAEKPADKSAGKTEGGVIDLPLGDAANKSFAYVPPTYSADIPHGLIIYLPEAGKVDQRKIIDAWDQFCRQNRWIFAVVSSADEKKWSLEEAELVVRTLTRLQGTYNIDASRTVVGGMRAGGSLAILAGFNARNRFGGIFALYPNVGSGSRIAPSQPLEAPKLLLMGDKPELQEAQTKFDSAGYITSWHSSSAAGDGVLVSGDQAVLQMWLRGLERL